MTPAPQQDALAPAVPVDRTRHYWWLPIVIGAIVGIAIRLVFSGKPGNPYNAMMTSFALLVPIVVGAMTVVIAERIARRSWSYYFWAAAAANALFVIGTLVILIEGLICAVLALPLFAILGGLSGILTGALCRWLRRSQRAIFSIAALPLVLGAVEQRLPLPSDIGTVKSDIMVAAAPDEIWVHLMSAAQIRPSEMDEGWMYRIGVPVPLSAITERRGNELIRHITMGKNIHFDQVASAWEPGHRVLWTYRFAEDSFPARALDDHVKIGGEYFDLLDTEYTISEAPNGARLSVVMRYRVSTNFNWYVGPLARLLVRNFEETALKFYAHRAEARPPGAVFLQKVKQ